MTSRRADAAPSCPACGATVDPRRLGGVCAACVWAAVLEPDQEEAAEMQEGPSLLRIPGHTVLDEIARGGMGIVYLARQTEPERTVALKMLLPQQAGSEDMRERFRLEARAIASLDHPAILPVYQVGAQQGLPFFTMKFAAGGTLATRRGQYQGQFRRVAELVATLADAVQFAHERGILHRDLKPGNILFDEAGRPYVSDFGLAKFVAADDGLTLSAHFLGTPHYLAPEVATGSARFATTASDIYALGAILYELLAGRPPFEGEGIAALLKRVAAEEPARLPIVPRDLEVICLKCLSKEPRRRYGSARELAGDLRRWLDAKPILARPVSRVERGWKWARRNPVTAVLAASLMLATASGGLALVVVNFRLQQALGGSRAALQESLLAQARLERAGGQAGQRFDALDLVERAAALSPAPREDARTLALRAEVAGALALPDLRTIARWPVHVSAWGSAVDFTDDLAKYAEPAPGGGFDVRMTSGHRLVRHFAGAARTPAIEFRFSRDGGWVAAVFQDGRVEVHELGADRLPKVVQTARGEVEFLPAGLLVSGEGQGLALHVLPDSARRVIVPPPVTVTAFQPDPGGERVAVCARNAVEVVRVRDGARLWSRPFPNRIARPAWSPDGRYLAIADSAEPYETTVFDLDSGGAAAHFQDHELMVRRLAFHPDGRSLASVGFDNRLVWRQLVSGGQRVAHQGGWRVLRFSRDGRRLAYEPGHGEAGLAEVTHSAVFHEWRRTTPNDEATSVIEVSPDGRLVATAGVRDIQLWDAAARVQIGELRLPKRVDFIMLLFHPDGRSVLYSAPGYGIVQVELRRSAGPSEEARVEFGAARRLGDGSLQEFAPDGRSLIVGARQPGAGRAVWLWPDADPARARPLTDDFPMAGYHLTADGRWGLSAHLTTPDVWIWDPRTARRVRSLGIPDTADAQPTPDGRWIFVTTREKHQLWEAGTWKPGPSWSLHSQQRGNWAVAFSRDGRWIATLALEGRIEIRSLPDAKLILELPPPQPLRLHDMDFSADGSRLYLLQGTGRLLEWDLAELRRELAKRSLDWRD